MIKVDLSVDQIVWLQYENTFAKLDNEFSQKVKVKRERNGIFLKLLNNQNQNFLD
jgi:hypothetical protein